MADAQKVPPGALEYAMKILSKRAYAESEIRLKLQKKSYSKSEIDQAVEDCKRYSFINDEAYAADYAVLLNSRGCGSILIRRKLAMLRIDEVYIDAALARVKDVEFEAARSAFDFKKRMLSREKDKFKKKQKLYAFMVSRGYPFDIIRILCDEFDME